MSQEKLFNIFINSLQFDVQEYLVEGELTELQKEIINDATFIMKENIIEEENLKTLGGSIKKNEEKFKELMKKAEEELENEKYKDIKKDLREYLKNLKELILKTCIAIIPVKELPWVDVIFRTFPRIVYDNNKVEFFDNAIAYYGEIKCLIGRITIYGNMKDADPLFAPFMGNLDLSGYKLDESEKAPKSLDHSYVYAVIDSFDSAITKNQLAKYHEGYQRHGDPICDFLMKDDDLLESMRKVKSGIDSGRIKSDIAVNSIAIPMVPGNTTLVIVSEEDKTQSKYSTCFEALLKFSASCCEVPSPSTQPPITTPTAQQPGAVRTPGGQELKAWTAEELAAEAQKRMSSQPDMPVWSEEELMKFAAERGSGIPEGMDVWTEEELQDLAEKRRGGGLNIPEWEPDQDMQECSNCGYSLRKGWAKCPICDTPVDSSKTKELVEDDDEDELEAEEKATDQEPEDSEDLN
ncbi:MAG: hypothetical protein ACFE85_09075 [Candidatus Hodarchaeota archaeon]